MSIPQFVDGETDLDSITFNRIVNRVNAITDGTAPIALAGIEGALGEYESQGGRFCALNYLPSDPDLGGDTDYTEELLAWLAAGASDGAGSNYSTDRAGANLLPPGVYGFSGELVVDGWASLQGLSASHTAFKALGSDARIRFASAGAGRWARHGGFTVDGNGLADLGIIVRTMNGTAFDNIHVVNCAGNGIEFHNTQNAVISNLHSTYNGGSGLIIDDGSGSLTFVQPQMNNNTRHQLLITDSDTYSSGYAQPQFINFLGGIAEHQPPAVVSSATGGTASTLVDSTQNWTTNEWVGAFVTHDPGGAGQQGKKILSNTATTLTVEASWNSTPVNEEYRIHWPPVRIDAAREVLLTSFLINPGNVSVEDSAGDYPLLHLTRAGNTEQEASVSLLASRIYGDQAYHTGIEIDGEAARLNVLDEMTTLQTLKRGVRLHANTNTWIRGRLPQMSSVTNEFVGDGGATLGAYATEFQRGVQRAMRHAATSNRIEYSYVVGDSGMRSVRYADGKIGWGDGSSFSEDTNLYRSAANVLKTDDKLIAAAGLGVGNSASASTPGTVTAKIEVFNASGVSLGFLPVYDGIS